MAAQAGDEQRREEQSIGLLSRLGRQVVQSSRFVLSEWRHIIGPTPQRFLANLLAFGAWCSLVGVVYFSSSVLVRTVSAIAGSAIAGTVCFAAMERVYIDRIRRILEEQPQESGTGDGGNVEGDGADEPVLKRLNELAAPYEPFWAMAAAAAAVAGVAVALLAAAISLVAFLAD